MKYSMKLLLKPLNDEIKSMYHDDVTIESNNHRMDRGDAGFDLYFPGDVTINAKETKMIDLKIQCEGLSDNDDRNVCYYLYPRSSISKTPLRLANSVGIIDSGYRGSLIGAFRCLPFSTTGGATNYTVIANTRLLQICHPTLCPIYVTIVNANDLSSSVRGDGGFGSTK